MIDLNQLLIPAIIFVAGFAIFTNGGRIWNFVKGLWAKGAAIVDDDELEGTIIESAKVHGQAIESYFELNLCFEACEKTEACEILKKDIWPHLAEMRCSTHE